MATWSQSSPTSIGTVFSGEWSSRFTVRSVSEWGSEHIPGTRGCDYVSFEGWQAGIRQASALNKGENDHGKGRMVAKVAHITNVAGVVV
jgi:hypothetical protein